MRDIENKDQEFESFLYIITHDLKTYSRAMRVIPEWIEEDLSEAGLQLPNDVAGHVAMLKDYARGMDLMLDGLTELSRVGRLADPPSPIPLATLFGAVWSRLPGHERFSFDLSGCKAWVQAPANDLDRLAVALLSNPIRHHSGPDGYVSVTAYDQGGRVILRIQDNGPGIDAEFREKVFQPLYTLAPRDEVGTAGIGLAVARKVVGTLGGTISIIEPPGGIGCAVECDLPLARQA